jgi:competence protein ComEC
LDNWQQYPFVRLILPLVVGIWLAEKFPFNCYLLFVPLLVLFSFLFLCLAFPKKFYRYKYRFVFGLGVFVSVLILAFQISSQRIIQSKRKGLELQIKVSGKYLGRVISYPVQKQNSVQVPVLVFAEVNPDVIVQKNCPLLLYLQKDDRVDSIRVGSEILLEARLNTIRNSGNPGAFDYRTYMARKGFFLQAYIKSENWKLIDKDNSLGFGALVHNIRAYILSVLQSGSLSGQESAVASAILLGHDDLLDPDLKSAFANAGAMHILCVSGLHVGIIYLFLNFVFSFLRKIKYGKIIQTILVVLLIWMYAALTGFSPSVLRAATMFSFVAFGRSMQRQTYIYNTLAASAFLILWFNPMSLFEIGFQLSYSAVFFIVWLQPLLKKLFYVKFWLLRKTWDIVTVSIAATLGTLPLSVFYFHQFPNYFILTNIMVIPLSFLIVFCGIFLLVTSFLPFFTTVFSFVLKLLLTALNSSVQFVDDLPGATTDGLFINAHQLVLSYSLLLLFFLFFITRNYKILKYLMASFLLFLLSVNYDKIERLKRNEIVVYNINGGFGIDFIAGQDHYFLTDKETYNDERKMKFNVENHWLESGLNPAQIIYLDEQKRCNGFFKKDGLIIFQNKTMLLVDQECNPMLFDSLQPDIVFLSKDPNVSIAEIDQLFRPENIILLSNNKAYNLKKWQKEVRGPGAGLWDLDEKGAFSFVSNRKK